MDYQPIVDFLNIFLQAVLAVAVPILATQLTRWALSKVAEARGAATEQQLMALDTITRLAVQAAEQAKLGGFVQDKKVYAIGVAEGLLKQYGVKVDLTQLSSLIEAAVLDEFNRDKLEAA